METTVSSLEYSVFGNFQKWKQLPKMETTVQKWKPLPKMETTSKNGNHFQKWKLLAASKNPF